MSDGLTTSNTVCGRAYTTVKGHDVHPPKTFFIEVVDTVDSDGNPTKKKVKKERKSFYVKPRTKFIVDGIMHSGGEKPIRFKSLEKAEAYIKNFRLEK